MKLIIDAELNQDDTTSYGWYLYGYIKRSDKVTHKYDTDTSLISLLKFQSIEAYRNLLATYGTTTLANGRTCFETKEIAESAIPELMGLLNSNMIG